MRKLKSLIYFILAVALSIVIYNWFIPMRNHINTPAVDKPLPEGVKEGEDQALDVVRLLIDQGRTQEALMTIQRYDRFISEVTPKGKVWIQLLILASTQAQDSKELTVLWTYFPDAFVNHEKAILLVAQHLLANGRTKDYEKLRKLWKGKETLQSEWFFLDADALSLNHDSLKTIQFLKSHTLQGKDDAFRLLRLAVEVSKNDPTQSWELLNKAVEVDPQSVAIRLYRARFLEMIGKEQNAEAEYIAIVQGHPNNIVYKNQLADFFLRQGMYLEALTVLIECLTPPSSDVLWLKTYFWNKVVIPVSFDWKNTPIPQGTSTTLLKYLIDLPEDVYWNEFLFEKVKDGQSYLSNIQPTLWLHVIQKLIDKEEKTAAEILHDNPFTNYSLYPALEKALLQILNYRIKNSLKTEEITANFPVVGNSQGQDNDGENEFFLPLDRAAANLSPLDKSLDALISSEEAFAGAFLAARWNKAAVALHRLEIYPETFPLWMSVKMGHALHEIKGTGAAIAFLDKQKPHDALKQLKAQILIADKKIDAAIEILFSIKDAKDEIGKTATWFLAEIYLERGDTKKAEEMLVSRKDLLEETRAQETRARIALVNRQIEKGEEIYKNIEDKSVEAKSYFANKAFLGGDFEKARTLTLELVEQYPANPILRLNLQQIILKQNELNGSNIKN